MLKQNVWGCKLDMKERKREKNTPTQSWWSPRQLFFANLTSDRLDMESVAKSSGVRIDNSTVNQLQSLESETYRTTVKSSAMSSAMNSPTCHC